MTFAWRKEVADLLAKGDFFPFDSRERSAPQSGDFAATENSLLLKITRVPLWGLRRGAGVVVFDRLLGVFTATSTEASSCFSFHRVSP